MSKNKVEYEGRDLEAMDFAVKYHTWILDVFKPYLGDTVMEAGAGSGSFTELIAEKTAPKKIIAIEPSDEMYPLLEKTLKKQKKIKISTYKNFFGEVKASVKKEKPTSAVYINVFEHIEDDRAELRHLYETMPTGSHICIFVPANQWLLSDFDKSIGHHRRYSKKDLVSKVQEAGFEIKLAKRFDFAGVLPWYIKFKLLGSKKVEPGLVGTYDNLVVPIIRPLESAVEPLVGKNVILVAEKK